ncbi:30S ribosomal protein S4 [Candidatus Uhrbacteria bacterium]|nr:30S ribosomal protein S4 [Candidatus Uhrbacteria bacterium]
MNKQPKYKICRRLGLAVFSKCENPKFSPVPKQKMRKSKSGGRALSEYGTQLLEKQRARFSYNLRERQFSKYVREATEKKGASPAENLYRTLESRLDNTVFRLGFAKSRAAARQAVSHGHVVVNGKKITAPSFGVRSGDTIHIREESKGKGLFSSLSEKLKEYTPPAWLSLDALKKEGRVVAMPSLQGAGETVNLTALIEFYGR